MLPRCIAASLHRCLATYDSYRYKSLFCYLYGTPIKKIRAYVSCLIWFCPFYYFAFGIQLSLLASFLCLLSYRCCTSVSHCCCIGLISTTTIDINRRDRDCSHVARNLPLLTRVVYSLRVLLPSRPGYTVAATDLLCCCYRPTTLLFRIRYATVTGLLRRTGYLTASLLFTLPPGS